MTRSAARRGALRAPHIIAYGLVLLVVVFAGDASQVRPASASSVDEVHYTYTGPHSVTFDWRGTAQDISYGATAAYGTTVMASTPDPDPFSSAGPFWEARLSGLSPGSTYHYSIGGGLDQTFSTAPTGDFRFDVEADIGDSTSYPAMLVTQDQISSDQPSFVLAVGDLTYGNNHGQSHVDQHFNDVMAWSRTAAYMPAWGNHEWDTPTTDDLRNYKGRFDLPNAHASVGAPAEGCCGEDWGWFDAGGVRFISYPEPYTSATWPEWQAQVAPIMAAAQVDPSINFIVTYGHRPAYSTGHHPGMPVLASILDGFGDTYSKYVLNFNGHSHDYERFVRIHGVTHVTGAGGGASLEVQGLTTDSRSAYRAMHLEHVRVDVTATAMHIDAVCGPATSRDDITCTEGSVIDSVTIPAPVPAPVSPPSTEFVGNPGFEVDTSGWNGVGSGVGLTRVAGGHSGDWAADVSKSDPTPSRCFLTDSPNWVAVSSSGTYTAGLWARADQSGSTLTLRLREYSNGVRVNIASQPVSLTTSWQEVSVALTPLAPGDSTIDLSAGLSDAPDGGCFYVDDVSLTLAP